MKPWAYILALALYGCATPEPRMERTTYSPPLGPLVVEIGNDAWCAEKWMVDRWWRADCAPSLGVIRIRGRERGGKLVAPDGVLDHEMRHLLWPQGGTP